MSAVIPTLMCKFQSEACGMDRLTYVIFLLIIALYVFSTVDNRQRYRLSLLSRKDA